MGADQPGNRERAMRRGARATPLIFIGCAMGMLCAQAQTNDTVVASTGAAPRGCFYFMSLKPLFPVKTPKEFSRVRSNVAPSVFENNFTGWSRSGRIQPIKSSKVLSVTPVKPLMTPLGAMERDDGARLHELACGMIRGNVTTSKQ